MTDLIPGYNPDNPDFDSLNVFKKFRPYIPWFDTTHGNYGIVIQPAAITPRIEIDKREQQKEQAVNAFIEFYLPEFYPYLYDLDIDEGSSEQETYLIIRGQINNALVYKKSNVPSSGSPAYAAFDQSTAKFLWQTQVGAVNFKTIRLGLLLSGAGATSDNVASLRRELRLLAAKGLGDCPDDPNANFPSYPSGFPDFETALGAFNDQQGIASPGTPTLPAQSTSISLGLYAKTVAELEQVLKTYRIQLAIFPSPLKIPLNLDAISLDIKKVMVVLKENTTKDINLSGLIPAPFGADDQMTIEIDDRQQIKSITYEVDMGDELVTEPLKIGYFSFIKYNPAAKDRWLMATLAKQHTIITRFKTVNRTTGPGLPTFLSFVDDTYGALLADPTANPAIGDAVIAFAGPAIPGVDAALFSAIFTARDSEAPLDVSNPVAMAESISNFMTSDEVGRIQAALSNPVMMASLYNESKNKSFSSSVPLPKIMDRILDMIKMAQGHAVDSAERKAIKEEIKTYEAELAYYRENYDRDDIDYPIDEENAARRNLDDAQARLGKSKTVKKDIEPEDVLETVLSVLGIFDLIMEALLCLTMGTGFVMDRINQAIELGFSIKDFIEDYEPPRLPRPMLVMPDLPEIPLIFNITGDPPLSVQIRDMILQVLAEVAFEIIKGIAELIKNNCDNLLNRPEQQGAIDIGRAFEDNLLDAGYTPEPIEPAPEIEDLVKDAFERYGFPSTVEGTAYLSDVSSVTTPLEVCRLFNAPELVSDETIDKIRIHNANSNSAAAVEMKSRNQILSFFQSMAQLADVTQVCNEIINSVDLRESFCDFCLTESNVATLADQKSINKLVDMLGPEGIPTDITLPDFICPDSETFIDSPIVSRVIPQVYNSLTQNVKMQFTYSVEAARTTLLEPTTAGNVNPALAEALDLVPGLVPPEPPVIDLTFLTILSDIMSGLSNGITIDPDVCPDLDMSKFGVSLDTFVAHIQQITDILNDGIALHQGAINDVTSRISDLQEALTAPTGGNMAGLMMPRVTYVFPTKFNTHFKTIGMQLPPIYEDIYGTANPKWYVRAATGAPRYSLGTHQPERCYSSQMVHDWTTDQDGRLRMKWYWLSGAGALGGDPPPSIPSQQDTSTPTTGGGGFGNIGIQEDTNPPNPLDILYGDFGGYTSISIEYFSNDDIENNKPKIRLRYPDQILPGVGEGSIYPVINNDASSPVYTGTSLTSKLDDMGNESGFNPYAFNFTYPLYRQIVNVGGGGTWRWQNRRYLENKLQKQVYPTLFDGMVKRTFEYISRNGMFTMPKLMALNLFKDNSNCSPVNVGDLLDVRGIIDQAKKQTAISFCDPGPSTTQERVTDALKLSLINLLIQVYLVEFIIKNIFVFAAFRFDEVMNAPALSDIIRKSIVHELKEKLSMNRPDLLEFIRDHFHIVMERLPADNPGAGYPARQEAGVVHSYEAPGGTPVPFLHIDAGPAPATIVNAATDEELIGFLVDERINNRFEVCGEEVSTMQSINNIIQKASKSKSWEDTFITEILGIYKSPYGHIDAPQKSPQGRLFFSKYIWWEEITNWSAIAESYVEVPWDMYSEQQRAELLASDRQAWNLSKSLSNLNLAGSNKSGGAPTQAEIDAQDAQFIFEHGEIPTLGRPRRLGKLRALLGSQHAGAMPIQTDEALDFHDLILYTVGTRPAFSGLKTGFKLIYNFPHYFISDPAVQAGQQMFGNIQFGGDWTLDATEAAMDQSASPFVESFKTGRTRTRVINAMKLQARSPGKNGIKDSVQSDRDSTVPGSQVMGEMLSVVAQELDDFDGNGIADVVLQGNSDPPQPPPQTNNFLGQFEEDQNPPNPQDILDGGTPLGNTNDNNKWDKILKFNRRKADFGPYLLKIKNDTEYQRFIGQTFPPDLIRMVPLLYNMGLTSYFFPGIEKDFKTTKNVILNLFETVSSTNQTPSIIATGGGTRLQNSLGSVGESDLDANIREFILKALAMTPIKILKGVVELVDPHVAISKIIRDITGGIFLLISQGLDVPLRGAEVVARAGGTATEDFARILNNLTGEDLLALGLCSLNTLNAAASGALNAAPGMEDAVGPLLGPRMTLNGVDFTGTIAGLFMMPPSPMGLIYLLIMLLDSLDEDELQATIDGKLDKDPAQKNVSDIQSSNVC